MTEIGRLYHQLALYTDERCKELSEMYEPYMRVTDMYGQLICGVTWLLGHVAPQSEQDRVVRDLLADVFDSLYESRALIMSAKCNVAFPVIRRAYESLSLMALCILDPSYAERWNKGDKIENHEVREQLAKHPMGEAKEHTRELYRFFCIGTHPNRDLIPHRYLGEGNEFVLGHSIGVPCLSLITEYCWRHLNLWFWFGAVTTYFYKEIIVRHDTSCFDLYSRTAVTAQEVAEWLLENYNRLLEEESQAQAGIQETDQKSR